MAVQKISVVLGSEIIYVTGSVNGVDKIFTLEGGLWVTTADRAADDVYHLSLLCVDAMGNQSRYEETIFLGIELVFDRTAEDVRLNTTKGHYGYTDLNRVESAVKKLSAILQSLGYTMILPEVKTDWHEAGDVPEKQDVPTTDEMTRYLDNIRLIRGAFEVFETTPSVPSDMRFLTHIEANNIEKVLNDVYILIENLQKQVRYSTTFYAGEE